MLYNKNPHFQPNFKHVFKHKNINYDPKAKTDKNHPKYLDPDFCEPFYKDYTKEVKSFFTLRNMWWGYWKWGDKRYIGGEHNWSFGYDMHHPPVHKMDPDDRVALHKGQREQTAVTPAQHSATMTGRSWTVKNGSPKLNEYDLPVPTTIPWLGKKVKNPEHYGIYFQERWNEALKSDPNFIYINDWNEWKAGKYNAAEGKHHNFMSRKSNFIFHDQYNAEFSRTLQPLKGGFRDNYYMQMVQNIRKYKGARPIPTIKGEHHIKIDGSYKDWGNIKVEYRDTIGDTIHRDYPGYGSEYYVNQSGRNDIVSSKVNVQQNQIQFYVKTKDKLSNHYGKNWMLLLIDTDQNPKTGWFGYDILINQKVFNKHVTSLQMYNRSKSKWGKIHQIQYRFKNNELELGIPRAFISNDQSKLNFDFHWVDNPESLHDPISLCTHGDSAPNRRFNYRFKWEK